MDADSKDLDSVFWVRHMRDTGISVQNLWAGVLEEHDLTWLQFEILVLLSENGELKQTEIGEAVGLDRSSMVSVIDRLEQKRLVTRQPCPYDRRAVHIALMPDGVARLQAVIPFIRSYDQDLVSSLGTTDRDMLLEYLNRLMAQRVAAAAETSSGIRAA